jgi:hypothetical protein
MTDYTRTPQTAMEHSCVGDAMLFKEVRYLNLYKLILGGERTEQQLIERGRHTFCLGYATPDGLFHPEVQSPQRF